jgi:hypothetical protein
LATIRPWDSTSAPHGRLGIVTLSRLILCFPSFEHAVDDRSKAGQDGLDFKLRHYLTVILVAILFLACFAAVVELMARPPELPWHD